MSGDATLQYYQPAAEWLRNLVLRTNGEAFTKMVWRSPFWFAYNDMGECLFRVEEELMERILALAAAEHDMTPEEWAEIANAVIPPSRPALFEGPDDAPWGDDYEEGGI